MNSKLIVIGQAPAKTYGEEVPLAGAARDTLLDYAGLKGRLDVWDDLVEPMNVLKRYPGSEGKGDRFPIQQAKAEAELMADNLHGRKVIFLGRHVERAFEMKLPWFQWDNVCFFGSEFEVALCPHPSGVNRWWNNATNVERAEWFLHKTFLQQMVGERIEAFFSTGCIYRNLARWHTVYLHEIDTDEARVSFEKDSLCYWVRLADCRIKGVA